MMQDLAASQVLLAWEICHCPSAQWSLWSCCSQAGGYASLVDQPGVASSPLMSWRRESQNICTWVLPGEYCFSENILITQSAFPGLSRFESGTSLETLVFVYTGYQVLHAQRRGDGQLSPDHFSCLMVLGCLLGHGRSEDDCGDERSRHRDSHLLAGRLERDQEKLLR